jgi:hypothetical protein
VRHINVSALSRGAQALLGSAPDIARAVSFSRLLARAAFD